MESTIQNPEARRTTAKSFEDLIVWQKAHMWVLLVYRLSDAFPTKENFALTSQLRRAAMSVPANIAEDLKSAVPVTSCAFITLPKVHLRKAAIL